MQLNAYFNINKKRCKVELSSSGISWETENKSQSHSYAIHEIVGCWLCPKGSKSCCESRPASKCHDQRYTGACKHWGLDRNGVGFCVEVCQRVGKGHKWKTKIITMHHPASDVIFTWHVAVWAFISELRMRPRKLLVVVNPFGGHKKAMHIFRNKVTPLFKRANIQFSYVQTEYSGHATNLMNTWYESNRLNKTHFIHQNSYSKTTTSDQNSMKGIDGVVAIGGDGLVSEIVKGLILAVSKSDNIDAHNPDSSLPSTPIRLGIIPGGSTDATCHATHGTSDIVTSILHIIMGDYKAVDCAGIYSDNELKGIATSIVSFGYFGDLMATSERLRNLGPSRYLLTGIWKVLNNKSYDLSVKIRKSIGPNSTPVTNKSICSDQCVTCSKASLIANGISDSEVQEQWEEHNGRYQIVSATVTSCTSRLNKFGLSPSAHLGDGCSDIILVKGKSRFKLLSYLFKTSCGNAMSLDHVDIIRGKEIHFNANQLLEVNDSCWSCDGELISAPTAIIKVHCQKLQLFCRGVEKRETK